MAIRIAVTGKQGQVARSLIEAAPAFGIEVIALCRPELDLAAPRTILPANSRLDCRKLASVHGIKLPSWSTSLKVYLERLINDVRRHNHAPDLAHLL
jgi:dTDP-4-dehydrorhamnose reductase